MISRYCTTTSLSFVRWGFLLSLARNGAQGGRSNITAPKHRHFLFHQQ